MTVLNVPMFKGSMTRTLLKCFPPGKQSDKKPVPNELSVLIFYLQTRPQKIPKAAGMLAQKSAKFAAKNNLGNLNVCGLIMHEIVTSLPTHINLFAKGALDVIETLLDKSAGEDMAMFRETVELFADYNRVHDGVLFSGFPGFTQHFLQVVKKFTHLSQSGSAESRILSVMALNSLGSSPAINNRQGKNAISIALKGILHNITVYEDTIVEQASTEPRITDFSDRSLNLVSYIGLHRFLTIQSLSQVIKVLETVLAWLVTQSQDWNQLLLLELAKWVPPQNRFVVAITAVALMVQEPIINPELKVQMVYSDFINALLKADDSKFGLSVVDVLRRLISLQHRVIKEIQTKKDDQSKLPSSINNTENLVSKLRTNIAVLTDTQIYPGQSGDMVNEILVRYSTTKFKCTTPINSTTRPRDNQGRVLPRTNSMQTVETVNQTQDFNEDCLLNDFQNIYEVLNRPATEGQKLPLASWEGTHWILELQSQQILKLYVQTFEKYLSQGHQGEHVSTKRGSLLSRNFCRVMLQNNLKAGNYQAVYRCLNTLCVALKTQSIFLTPWLAQIIETRKNNVRMSAGLQLCLEVYTICERPRVCEYLESQIREYKYANKFVDLQSAYLGDADLNGEWDIQLDKWPLSEQDMQLMLNPPFCITEDLDEEIKPINVLQERPRALSGRSLTSFSEMSTPRVGDLVKRQTDTISLRSGKSSVRSMHTGKQPLDKHLQSNVHGDLRKMLSSVELDRTNRGRLTV